MAEENEEVVVDKKEAKKLEKARRKEEKKRAKQEREQSDDLEMDGETIGGKIAVFFVTIIIILVWLVIFGLLIKWDVGGFGSGVLAPVLKNVPYVNKILPDPAAKELSTEDSAYAFDSMDAAVAKIKELEIALDQALSSTSENAEYVAQLEAQAAELQKYREEEAAFEEEKQSFYEDVVFSDVAPDIEEYKKYYESIDPANAEVLYKQVVTQTLADEEIKDYVNTYSAMKPKEAAAIFDTMTNNLKLVAQILENMDAQSRADILGKMDAETAAKVTEILKPSE